jgi:hypothetical protein
VIAISMLEQAEATRRAVGLAQERAMLAACNVVHALAGGTSSEAQIRELSVRTVALMDEAADLAQELAAILGAATAEDERRAEAGSAPRSSVWLAGQGTDRPPDDVADRLRHRLLGLADQAGPLASAANEVIDGMPRAHDDAGEPRPRNRYAWLRQRPRSATHRGL